MVALQAAFVDSATSPCFLNVRSRRKGISMEYILLPTLLTAGLLWWLFDDLCGSDDSESDDKTDVLNVTLTQGADVFVGTEANENISALGGDDDISGKGGNDILRLAWGNDSGAGGEGDDTIGGGAGNDVLNGGPGDDLIQGGKGNDIVGSFSKAIDRFVQMGGKMSLSDAELASAKKFMDRDGNSDLGNDTIQGGDGDDFLTDFAGDNSISGGTGNDFISALDKGAAAGKGVDTLDGGYGDDVLEGDDGDIMTGGAGTDTFRIIAAATAERAVVIKDFEAGESVKIHVEDAKDTDRLTLTTEGSTARIMLHDRVLAEVENIDTAEKLESLRSGIVLNNNGSGIDAAPPTSGGSGFTATTGNDVFMGTPANDSVDMLAGNDTAYGAGGDDLLVMNSGDDVAAGEAGNDTLDGGAGMDLLNGGMGDDSVSGGDGTDILSKSSAYLATHGAALGLSAAQISDLQSKITNSRFNDGGNDTLDGGAGNDLITDFAGDNLLRGGDGHDVISALDKGAGAGTGVDTIDGGAGNDWLQGDDGDIMTGGPGTDSFNIQYEQVGDAPVTITDFQPGETVRVGVVGAPQGAALSYAIVGGNAELSLNGVKLAVVNGISTPAQLAQLQATTTLVSLPAA